MNIGFTGHRNCITARQELDTLRKDYPNATWIHGGAKSGFDYQVKKYIEEHNLRCLVFLPEYKKHPQNPRIAPILRNYQIVEASDLIVACWDGRTKGGTYSTIEYAMQRRAPILYVSYTIITQL